ncbi:MAG: hypothetical protein E2576_14465 [Alcaligenaceae bacterium]|nr:hypothetical protein [Alcaligenaceae bacterium SAGV5]MPS50416.1 hypothetical protein [Alcaligenaceae bacterium SAGV3]MPT57923.1 hypothetical protein [Alcaligenaceae bacterium]
MRKLAIAVLMAAAPFAKSFAAESALTVFRGATGMPIVICKMYGSGVMKGYSYGDDARAKQDSEKLDGCIANAEISAKSTFPDALALAQEKGAGDALKTYYAVWLSSLRGARPRAEDSEYSYVQRVNANDQRLEDAWAKVEIDAGL